MTQSPGDPLPSQENRNSQSTPEVAREEASNVARTALSSGGDVMETAAQQAKQVTHETARQARNLLAEGKDQVTDQARQGQQKAAGSLHTLADQLEEMSRKSDNEGIATGVVQQAADRTRDVASWLEQHEPGDLLTEVRAFARRRPGMFLAGAALAGVLAGRLTRGVVASQSKNEDAGASPDRGMPAPRDGNAMYANEPAPVTTTRPTPTPVPTPTPTPSPTPRTGYAVPPAPAAPPIGQPPFNPQDPVTR